MVTMMLLFGVAAFAFAAVLDGPGAFAAGVQGEGVSPTASPTTPAAVDRESIISQEIEAAQQRARARIAAAEAEAARLAKVAQGDAASMSPSEFQAHLRQHFPDADIPVDPSPSPVRRPRTIAELAASGVTIDQCPQWEQVAIQQAIESGQDTCLPTPPSPPPGSVVVNLPDGPPAVDAKGMLRPEWLAHLAEIGLSGEYACVGPAEELAAADYRARKVQDESLSLQRQQLALLQQLVETKQTKQTNREYWDDPSHPERAIWFDDVQRRHREGKL